MISAAMWEDPIVEEVRRIRERLFAECGYDLHTFFEKMRELEAKDTAHEIVSYPPRLIEPSAGPEPEAPTDRAP